MDSLPVNDARRKYLDRKARNQRRYYNKNKDDVRARAKNDNAYVDREQRRNAKRHASEWQLHPSRCEPVIIDGEADENGCYYLFQAYAPSIGLLTLRENPPRRLGLLQVARFLWAIQKRVRKEQHKKSVFLYFAMGYDISQQLYGDETRGKLTHNEAQQLWDMRSRRWGSVRGPDFRPEMFLARHSVSIYNGRKQGHVLFHNDTLDIVGRVAWQDMFSLSNKGLVSTIKDWAKFWTDGERASMGEALAHVELGKAARGQWAARGYTPEQIEQEYQLPELQLMYWYARKIIDLCTVLGLAPRSLAGPAPMARALLHQFGVVSHIKPADYDTTQWQESEVMREWIRRAMFGGNIQLAQTGVIAGYEKYDITSAYPHWVRQLPCMAHGSWRKLSATELTIVNAGTTIPHALYDVVWKCAPDTRWPPFPVRDTHGAISYPLSGHGRYCGPEVQAFLDCHGATTQYDIREGWVWEPTCEHAAPFADLIETTFARRAEYKRLGMPEGNILKLALNSIYGVLAQTSGSYRETDSDGNTTGYHTPAMGNLFAAALITSGCRADLMRMVAAQPDSVIGTMTDAVLCTAEMPLQTGTSLGSLEHEACSCATACIAPGVLARDDDHNKYRGVPSSATWEVNNMPYPTMFDAYQAAKIDGHALISAVYQAYQNPYAAGCDLTHAGAFIESRRQLIVTDYAIASKRDVSRTDAHGYTPPYTRASVGLSLPYVRPMDRGGALVPERPEHIES